MEISITVHQRGFIRDVIKPDEVSIGTKIEFKKEKGILSDYLITAYVKDETLGYVSEVPAILIEGTQVLTEKLYNQLPDQFEGVLEKKELTSKTGKTTNTVFGIKINSLVTD